MSSSSSSSSSKSINTINPSTGKVIATYNNAPDKEISGKVNSAQMAFQSWQKKSIAERSEYLRNLVKVLVKKKDEYSKLITEEMGKPCLWLSMGQDRRWDLCMGW
jgi:succinate-semialdehyde dehydrogenase/glutarate-semialdehyde dehydrogenase